MFFTCLRVSIRYALVAAMIPSLGAAQGFPSDDAVRKILSDRVALGRNPGIVVGLLDASGPRVMAEGVSGREEVDLNGATVFEIGSATKVFTAVVLEEMVRWGEVQLEDPVARFLPGHVRVPREEAREITLLDLATHLSGLPRMPLNFFPADLENPYVDYSVELMYTFLSEFELQRGIGTEWEYSNLGMGLLGHALSLKAGLTYEGLVSRFILSPLEMKDTGILLSPALGFPFAQGHNAQAEPVPLWDIPTLPGAGALRSTANDMLLFLAANLSSDEEPIFAALRRTHEVRVPDVAPGLSMALGWLVNMRNPDRPIIWHNGGTGGFHSFIGFDPSSNRGIVVLTNGTQTIDDIGFHLLDDRNPLSPPEPLGRVGKAPAVRHSLFR